MSDSELLACTTDVGRELTAERVADLAAMVEKCDSPDELAEKSDSAETQVMQKMAKRVADVWATGTVSSEAVAMALRAAQAAAEVERVSETVGLTWTGPKTKEVSVLRNDQALFEVIDSADDELLVVSAFTWDMPAVVEKLSSAVDRGVLVRLVLEYHDKDGQPTGFDPAKDLGGQLSPEILVYHWPPDVREFDPKTGVKGYLHVKCAVADGREAFVSSANLTVYAMETNMELGVVMRRDGIVG